MDVTNEWEKATHLLNLMLRLPVEKSERKLRLFGLACCQRVTHLMSDPDALNAVDIIEQNVEQGCFQDVLRGLRISLQRTEDLARAAVSMGQGKADLLEGGDVHFANSAPYTACDPRPAQAALDVANTISWALDPGRTERFDQETFLNCSMFRDIFGNPFRPVTLDPRWLTSTVLDLANTIYEHRQFERMPILADALMDAGCDNEEIIQHCQGPGPHVRGCWVVDLLTGRTSSLAMANIVEVE